MTDNQEKAYTKALAEYRAAQDGPPPSSGKRPGLRYFAKKHNIDFSTLSRRHHGKRSQSEYAATRQKLTVAEERVLEEFIIESADRGLPLNRDTIVIYANLILQAREGVEAKVGVQWIGNCYDRYLFL